MPAKPARTTLLASSAEPALSSSMVEGVGAESDSSVAVDWMLVDEVGVAMVVVLYPGVWTTVCTLDRVRVLVRVAVEMTVVVPASSCASAKAGRTAMTMVERRMVNLGRSRVRRDP